MMNVEIQRPRPTRRDRILRETHVERPVRRGRSGNAGMRHHRPRPRFRSEFRRDGDDFGGRPAGPHRARGLQVGLDPGHASARRSLLGVRLSQDKTGVPTAIGEKVVEVQKLWKRIYNYDDSSQWTARNGTSSSPTANGSRSATWTWMSCSTPGHTLASIAYLVGDAAFIHDTIFMPDGGTARADFPGGSARALWSSIQRIMALPDQTLDCSRAMTTVPRDARSPSGKAPSNSNASRTSI